MIGKPVVVEWRDTVVAASGWVPREDASFEKPDTCFTYGVLIAEDEKRVVVAQTVSDDQVNGYKTIPRAWIESISELRKVRSGGSNGARAIRKSQKAGDGQTKPSPITADSPS